MKHIESPISVVLPIYNEEDCLLVQLNQFVELWQKHIYLPFELIVVENGSTDESWSILTKFSRQNSSFVRLLRLPKPSYGQALKAGILNAKGKYILCIDIDYFDFSFIQYALNVIQGDPSKVVVGSKLLKKSRDDRSFDRKLATRMLSIFFRMMFGYSGTDTHGLKCFRNTDQLKRCLRQCVAQNELVDSELLLRLSKNKAIKIEESPVVIEEIRKSRYIQLIRYTRAAADLWRMILVGLWGEYRKHQTWPVIADDFGYSKQTDKEMTQAVEQGGVSTISVLANMATTSELKMLNKLKHLISISLHLNFVEGQPILPMKDIPTLVDRNGYFYTLPFFLIRLLLGLVSKTELEKEMMAQYQRLAAFTPIKHIDSHQHAHHFGIIKKLIEDNYVLLGKPSVRSLKSSYRYLAKKPLKCAVLFILLILLPSQKRPRSMVAYSDEAIVHPGFQYDG